MVVERVVRVAMAFAAYAALGGAAGAEGFIAGLKPEARPPGAPIIAAVVHDDAWLARALSGIEPPAPDSLRWLADQGAWFTPFNHAGMTGPYDIRGRHAAGAEPAR